jgi:SAM-dependent methyltransferase
MPALIANVEQARSWDGDDGDHWTEYASHYEAAVQGHYRHMRAAADIGSDERVLDVGCGTGETTIDAARAAYDGAALGIDLSSRMLAYARERARRAGLANARFEQADAQVHKFGADAFDIVISRTGGMFFDDPVVAYRNLLAVLRPRGRLVLLAWQSIEANEWLREIVTALAAGRDMPPPATDGPGPLSLSDPSRGRSILQAAGFVEIAFEGVNERFVLGENAEDAFEFMRGAGIVHGMLEGADDALRKRAMAGLRATFEAHAGSAGVTYDSGSWLITARKP